MKIFTRRMYHDFLLLASAIFVTIVFFILFTITTTKIETTNLKKKKIFKYEKVMPTTVFAKFYHEGVSLWKHNCANCHVQTHSPINPIQLKPGTNSSCKMHIEYLSPEQRSSIFYYLHSLKDKRLVSEWFYNFNQQQPLYWEYDNRLISGGPQKIFKQVCLGCHSFKKEGGKGAPSLDNLKGHYNEKSLNTWLQDPKFVRGKTSMPRISMFKEERDEIINTLLPQKDLDNKVNNILKNQCSNCHYFTSINDIDDVQIKKQHLFDFIQKKNSNQLASLISDHILELSKVIPNDHPSLNISPKNIKKLSYILLKVAPPSVIYEACLACHTYKGDGTGLYALDLVHSTFGMKYQDFINSTLNNYMYIKPLDLNDFEENKDHLFDDIRYAERAMNLNRVKLAYLTYIENFLGDSFDVDNIHAIKNNEQGETIAVKNVINTLTQLKDNRLSYQKRLNFMEKFSSKKGEKSDIMWKIQSIKDFLKDPVLHDSKGQNRYIVGNWQLEMPKPHLNDYEVNKVSKFLGSLGELPLYVEYIKEYGCLDCHSENQFVGGKKNKGVIVSTDSINSFPVIYKEIEGKSALDYIHPKFDLHAHCVDKKIDLNSADIKNVNNLLLNINSQKIEVSKAFVDNGCIVCHPFYKSDLTSEQQSLKNSNKTIKNQSIKIGENLSSIKNVEEFVYKHYDEVKNNLDKDMIGHDIGELNKGDIVKISNFLRKIQNGAGIAPVVYSSKLCSSCHRIGYRGGVVGPSLSKIGEARDIDYLKTWLRNPWSVKKNTRMPHVSLTENEINDLGLFLSNLK